jgi:predicted permease
MDLLLQDFRFARRTLRHARGWAAGVVLTLALGIGLATAVFTIADALLLRPMPVRDQDRVVVLWGVTRDGRTDHFPLLYRDARQFALNTRTLERVEFFAFGGAQLVDVDLGAGVARLRRSLVTGGYFDLLGTRPLLGRALRTSDDVTGAAPVAVLSYSGWQRFFGGSRDAIGREISLHEFGVRYKIVGVMPLGLDYPRGVDFWAAVVPNSGPLGDQPIYAELNVIGRLRRGVSVDDARTELTSFFAHYPQSEWMRQVLGVAHRLPEDVVGNVGAAVLAFASAAGLLLLITCINVSNLLLVRGRARGREIAILSALGAERGRLVLQLAMESAILAAGGAIVGIAFAVVAVRAFIALAPAGTPRLDEIHVGGATILAAIAITSLAAMLFAVVPTIITSRAELQDSLRTGAPQSGTSRRFRAGTEALVAGQMALALVVLGAAGLVVRSLVQLEHVDLAFEPSRLLVVELAFPHDYFGTATVPQQAEILARLTSVVESLPGVRSATPVFTAPFEPVGGVFGHPVAEGQTRTDAVRNPTVYYETVTPNYFRTFGVSLVRGRLFSENDRDGSLPVAVIGESVARHYWPGMNPLGKRFKLDTGSITIVGVVRDTRYRNFREPQPSIYIPLRQSPFPFAPTTLVVATDGRAADVVPFIRRAIGDIGSGVSVASAMPLESYVAIALAQPRLNAVLLALFAGAAVSLAAIGLFGVMAAAVRQRTREIGVRVALGATPNDVRLLVLGRALAIAAFGALVGLGAALATAQTLRSLLFGVSPTDVTTLASVSIALMLVALVAAYLPARRAQRVNPMLALRAE